MKFPLELSSILSSLSFDYSQCPHSTCTKDSSGPRYSADGFRRIGKGDPRLAMGSHAMKRDRLLCAGIRTRGLHRRIGATVASDWMPLPALLHNSVCDLHLIGADNHTSSARLTGAPTIGSQRARDLQGSRPFNGMRATYRNLEHFHLWGEITGNMGERLRGLRRDCYL